MPTRQWKNWAACTVRAGIALTEEMGNNQGYGRPSRYFARGAGVDGDARLESQARIWTLETKEP